LLFFKGLLMFRVFLGFDLLMVVSLFFLLFSSHFRRFFSVGFL